MKKDDLLAVMAATTDALKINREAISIEMLDKIDGFLNQLKSQPPEVVSSSLGPVDDIAKLFESLTKLIALERRILTENIDLKAISMLQKLSNRPIILAMLSPLL